MPAVPVRRGQEASGGGRSACERRRPDRVRVRVSLTVRGHSLPRNHVLLAVAVTGRESSRGAVYPPAMAAGPSTWDGRRHGRESVWAQTTILGDTCVGALAKRRDHHAAPHG